MSQSLVIADASPLISAALAGRLYLVRQVYQALILSEAIILAEELKAMLLADEALVIQEARKRGIPIRSPALSLCCCKQKN